MKKTVLKNAVSLLLVLVLIISAMPVCFADSSDDFMKKFNRNVKKPYSSSVLDEPETMYVTSNHGNCIYVYYQDKTSEKRLGEMAEGTEVTVYAIQNGFALALDEDSRFGGWVKYSLLSKTYGDGPNPLDLKGAPTGFQKPNKNDYLDDYETMYVKSKYGNCIYLISKPANGYKKLGTIKEAEEVTVLARRNGYSCVIVERTGEIGWCKSSLLDVEY